MSRDSGLTEWMLLLVMIGFVITSITLLARGENLGGTFGLGAFGTGMLIFALRLIKRQSRQSPHAH